jgi:hypothetical protein
MKNDQYWIDVTSTVYGDISDEEYIRQSFINVETAVNTDKKFLNKGYNDFYNEFKI